VHVLCTTTCIGQATSLPACVATNGLKQQRLHKGCVLQRCCVADTPCNCKDQVLM
jgi:hypothetical protein